MVANRKVHAAAFKAQVALAASKGRLRPPA
jgi:hypothetical protein